MSFTSHLRERNIITAWHVRRVETFNPNEQAECGNPFNHRVAECRLACILIRRALHPSGSGLSGAGSPCRSELTLAAVLSDFGLNESQLVAKIGKEAETVGAGDDVDSSEGPSRSELLPSLVTGEEAAKLLGTDLAGLRDMVGVVSLATTMTTAGV
mmetsp:Transcript_39692/g.105752  ORF Transcript_39692/g.105752 Transcript_39692/m.105752 type:complete len:156 (+) Transcript_39692:797-1264(+)